MILIGKKLLERFTKTNCKKQIKKNFKKMTKRKGDKLYARWKGYNNSFNNWIDKKDIVLVSECFPEQKSLEGRVNVELDLSNYATKADLKNATGVDTSSFAKNKLYIDKLKNVPSGSSSLKSKADKLDVDKLVPVPVDLSKPTDAVKNNVVKKGVYNAKIKNIKDKILDIPKFATKTTLNAKINEVKCEIPSITDLATTSALTAVENKIPNVNNLVKKTDYNTKINEIVKKN